MNATQLFFALLSDFKGTQDELKWPNEGSFEVVVGAILVQNTAWKNVQKALENLRAADKMSLEAIANISTNELATLIKPSGFYNTKAKRLQGLCKEIVARFGEFENFKTSVDREWLLGIKGVGAETCDAILAYACGRAVMVVDAYVLRILGHLGYEFDSYDEASEWLSALEYDKIFTRFTDADEAEILRIFHALVLEFCKAHFRGKILDQSGAEILNSISF